MDTDKTLSEAYLQADKASISQQLGLNTELSVDEKMPFHVFIRTFTHLNIVALLLQKSPPAEKTTERTQITEFNFFHCLILSTDRLHYCPALPAAAGPII